MIFSLLQFSVPSLRQYETKWKAAKIPARYLNDLPASIKKSETIMIQKHLSSLKKVCKSMIEDNNYKNASYEMLKGLNSV